MMKQGEQFIANADIAGARLVFRRAAEAGDAAATVALAETYDPLVLAKSGTKGGIRSDIVVARRWYEKARELGSPIALERIARLPQSGQ
jgi:TPR repeat protein